MLNKNTERFKIIPWSETLWKTVGRSCDKLYVLHDSGSIYKIKDWSQEVEQKSGARYITFTWDYAPGGTNTQTAHFSVNTGVMLGNSSLVLKFVEVEE